MVKCPTKQTPCLIFEKIPCMETKILARKLKDMDIRLYMYKLLQAVEHTHSHGIMHRDIKPLNIVINHEKRDLRLIDYGLAEYYHPDRTYSSSVATRYYKAPELLI